VIGNAFFLKPLLLRSWHVDCVASVVAVCLMSSVATSPALAQRHNSQQSAGSSGSADSDPIRDSVARWDANHDGVYTCEEWKSFVNRLFNLADKHHKGSIASAEFEIIRSADPLFARAEFSYFDSNGDGRVSRAEFVDAQSPFFARFDPKRTCSVSAADMTPKAPTESKPSGGHGRGRGGGGGGGRGGF
jgi:Ca2+-binding EF-hand superfamily protein